MKGCSGVFFLCILIMIENVTSQLASYGSSSGGGGLSSNRGDGGGGSRQGGGGFNRGSGGFVAQGSNGGGRGGGGNGDGGDHQGLDWLRDSVPGEPGVDYPIFALPVPDSSFSCDNRVEGGYYSDTELQCQAFQICVHDSVGGLVKYSFLCPNGSLFDQQYFICDFWFNVDCSQAESLYVLNDEIAAERESNIGAVASDSGIGAANGQGGQSGFGGNSFNGRGTNNGNRGSSSSNNSGGNRRPASKQPSTGYLGPRNTRELDLDEDYEEDEENRSSDYAYEYDYEE